MATRMQQRRGTSAEWAAANPVLADGEVGYEKDTGVVKIGNGTSTWNQLSPILGSSYLPILGKAYDSERLDGLDSTAFLQKTEATNTYFTKTEALSMGRDRGSGNAWPTTDNRRGDFYYHTAVAQLGFFDGTRYRLIDVGTVANVAARDALTWTYAGLQVKTADEGLIYEYQNTFLGWTRPWNEPWGELANTNIAVGKTLTGGYAEYGWTLASVPKGRKLRIRGKSYWYSASSVVSTIRTRIMLYRDTTPAPTTEAFAGIEQDRRIGAGYGDLAVFDYDTPFTVGGTLSGSVNLRAALIAAIVISNPNSSIVTSGSGPEQNYLTVLDVGPATPPPTS